MKKKIIVIALFLVSFGLSLVADYVIKGYYYPQKKDFESSGTGWILEKGNQEFGATVNVNLSGEISYYIFRTGADGLYGTLLVNGNNILSNGETFLGTLREGEDYFDASLTSENIVLVISEDAESFIMLFQVPESNIIDTDKSGTMMLVYPAASKMEALERLWEALPKSITLQRRLVELDWK